MQPEHFDISKAFDVIDHSLKNINSDLFLKTQKYLTLKNTEAPPSVREKSCVWPLSGSVAVSLPNTWCSKASERSMLKSPEKEMSVGASLASRIVIAKVCGDSAQQINGTKSIRRSSNSFVYFQRWESITR